MLQVRPGEDPRTTRVQGVQVLQVAPSLAPGGTERLVIEMSRHLRVRHGMAVCCLDEPGAWAADLRRDGIEVVARGRHPGFSPVLGRQIASVAARVGGTPEVVVDGRTGWLVPPRQPAAVASGFRCCAADVNRARAMGAEGRRRVTREFSLDRMLDAYRRVYESLEAC